MRERERKERERKEKEEERKDKKLGLAIAVFFCLFTYLSTFSIISMERNFREGWWWKMMMKKKKIFGGWEIRLWRVVGMRSWGIFGKEGKSER